MTLCVRGKGLKQRVMSGKCTFDVLCISVHIVKELTWTVLGILRFGWATEMVMPFIECTVVIYTRVVSRETGQGSSEGGE